MNWHPLTSVEQLDEIIEESKSTPVVIFKHSTSCSISATAKARIERQWDGAGVDHVKPYYLDLLKYRPVSNEVAEVLQVRHESPQLLLLQDGVCTYDTSHMSISVDALKKNITA
ncbi:bacillithiol system protein YtxJ [Pontibacter ummariensis]|uniref:Bacillithiol system protein YtxJ n=1 Tax=Pontibacter ummariensis TaxID=1610492 RepID=A0A239CWS7_9BACT|nr:bacillithiol system redox-active protein YtxJ [Pontibacter ummariensis]PRY14775.1 bacillithiol system protein YtxJ [Pontibacter ummariensis]SNS24706.1 bacillithiol system protein YtxJ [Pontibacter ummariensis]